MSEKFNLNQYLRYCLGYLSITKPTGLKRTPALNIALPEKFFSLINLLNGDTDGSITEDVSLNLYYNTNPKDVLEEDEDEYLEQKNFAIKLDEIYNKFKNDSFTKESVLKFGLFNFDVLDKAEENESEQENEEVEVDILKENTFITKKFHLFSISVSIFKKKKNGNTDIDIYSIEPIDVDVRLNISALYEIFGSYGKDDLIYEFLKEFTEYESLSKLSIPITSENDLLEVWNLLKSKLRLTEAVFNEDSFKLNDVFSRFTITIKLFSG